MNMRSLMDSAMKSSLLFAERTARDDANDNPVDDSDFAESDPADDDFEELYRTDDGALDADWALDGEEPDPDDDFWFDPDEEDDRT